MDERQTSDKWRVTDGGGISGACYGCGRRPYKVTSKGSLHRAYILQMVSMYDSSVASGATPPKLKYLDEN